MSKSLLRDEAIECNAVGSAIKNMIEVELKNDSDLIRISDLTHKPIITQNHEEYWVLDGNIAYTVKSA